MRPFWGPKWPKGMVEFSGKCGKYAVLGTPFSGPIERNWTIWAILGQKGVILGPQIWPFLGQIWAVFGVFLGVLGCFRTSRRPLFRGNVGNGGLGLQEVSRGNVGNGLFALFTAWFIGWVWWSLANLDSPETPFGLFSVGSGVQTQDPRETPFSRKRAKLDLETTLGLSRKRGKPYKSMHKARFGVTFPRSRPYE